MTNRLTLVLYYAAVVGALLVAAGGLLLAFVGYLINSLAEQGLADGLFVPLLTITLPLVASIVLLTMGLSPRRSPGARLALRTIALLLVLAEAVVIGYGYDVDLLDAGTAGYLAAACLLASALGSFGLVTLGVREQRTSPNDA